MVVVDMMPALHNYVTVDPAAFLSDTKRMEMIYNICKTVNTSFSLFVSVFTSFIAWTLSVG